MCHVYVRGDNLAGVVISDHEYPSRVSHTLITKILDEFSQKVDRASWPTIQERDVSFPQLNVYLSKYQNPAEADAMTKMQVDLDETKIILVSKLITQVYFLQIALFSFFQHNTIEAVLERGEKLDDLVSKSEGLSIQSKAFYKTARKTNSCCSFS